MIRNKLLLLMLVFALISCSGGIRYQEHSSLDLPGWSSFRGDPQNTAYKRSAIDLPSNILWEYDLDKPLKSSPIIVGRILVIGSLIKRIHFFDAVTGKHLGVHKVPSAVSTSACGEGSKIYFGLNREKETMIALDLKTGKVLWKRDLGDVSSSPLLCGNKIVVGSNSGFLWALNRENGEVVWRYKTNAPVISTPACHGSAGGTMDGTVIWFASVDGHLYALDSDSGSLIWEFKAQSGIYSSPAVKNGRVFIGSANGILYAVDSRDGSPQWTFNTGADIYSSPAAADSLVYVGSNDYYMYAVNQTSGNLAWRFKTNGLIRSSPIAVGDKLFFGSYDGNFYILNRFTGKLLWKYQTKGMISSSPAYYDGKVYIASEDGYLYCFGQ